ncbi:ATP synthase subunit delta- chloroplastic [Striga hermonthica]|uniref:ATP synthase subunit delta- chloroplastic n=1 Tax=Striga hermonthica TaxID=68872 RepID=A0A9N7NWD1_STRHE|nr:ATP synthase subunit delta- chloroplastic [Striga hermonthica]
MSAVLQQTPITFRSRSPPSAWIRPNAVSKLSLFSGLSLPRLAVSRRRGGGALCASMANSAAGSYANALADVAQSNGTLEQTAAELEKVVEIFSDEAVLGFFTNPTIGEDEKREIVDKISESCGLQPYVSNFLNILLDMKRIEQIGEIAKEFEAMYNQLTDTQVAVVTSVVQLEAQHLAQIAKEVQKLTGAKNVRLKTRIDPSLVAGFTIRYGGSGSKLIDLSVKKQLEEIATQIDLEDIQLAA